MTTCRPPAAHANGASNFFVEYADTSSLTGDVILVYGDCDITHHSAAHHEIGRFDAQDHEEKP